MRLPPNNNQSSGFTLVEMMLVVIIVGIMSVAISAEMHGSLQDAILRSTARELAEACRLASGRAVSVDRPHRLLLDNYKHRYLIERGNASGSDFLPAQDLVANSGALNPKIKVQIEGGRSAAEEGGDEQSQNVENRGATGESIIFYPDGTAESKQMELTDPDGFRLALRVNPITSRVQIQPVEGR